MKVEDIIVHIYKTIPYSDQISELNIHKTREGSFSLDFKWRDSWFLVSHHKGVHGFCVGEFNGECTIGTDFSLILKSLLNKTYISKDDF